MSFDLVERAVAAQVTEGQRLDFKRELPPQKGLGRSDLPKDVAAFANAEGGMLVYGVTEKSSAADQICGVARFDDNFERSIRQAVLNDISPPVHNVVVSALSDGNGTTVVTIEVPRSVDAPHCVNADSEGARRTPLRTGSDTRWLSEAEVAASYRRRFAAHRDAEETLRDLYERAYDLGRTKRRAWFVGVARPVIAPWTTSRRDRDSARELISAAHRVSLANAGRGYFGAFGGVDLNPRPTLRGWTAPPGSGRTWHEPFVSVFDDGSVAVSSSVGGHRTSSGDADPPHEIDTIFVESAVIDLVGLMVRVGADSGVDEYDVQVGIEYEDQERPAMQIWSKDTMGFRWDTDVRVHRFVPVRATISTNHLLMPQTADLARDLVNQGGVSHLQLLDPDKLWEYP